MILKNNIVKLEEPYVHLLLGDKNSLNTFTRKLYNKFKDIIVIKSIQGTKCDSKRNLFNEFSIKLEFPSYFGYNWDAFDECINDLSWLSGKGYIVVISDFDEILMEDKENLKIFTEVLGNAIKGWTSEDEDSIHTEPIPFHLLIHCLSSKEFEVKNKLSYLDIINLETINLKDIV